MMILIFINVIVGSSWNLLGGYTDRMRVSHMLGEMSDLVYNMINCDKPIVSAINDPA